MSKLASTLSRIRRTQPASSSQTRTVYLGSSLLAIAGIGYSIDRYVYANALSRTVRLAYNAGLTILDYKINFNPDSPPDKLHERVAQRISEVCIKNEGLYIKLGQSIAIQAAILPTLYKKLFKKILECRVPRLFSRFLLRFLR
ncbi:hypothetical protein PSTG_04487 [Puccinia striiformis f. sp. tritici PST-78]|uniref:Uncharacterized protein n=1 Tax=Puccinia striiformis f. sp. tritici PST-78 TaxID=1165861 RepID=A0A0L0VSM2_9BASI|nr:hypothetical protein PSTG_04487 [Puccinia striiformis f. sp. tritici PST-78]